MGQREVCAWCVRIKPGREAEWWRTRGRRDKTLDVLVRGLGPENSLQVGVGGG